MIRRLPDPRACGGALVTVILMVIVLDCIVLGTLHLSLQEHRLAANHTELLRLRLRSEGALRRALGQWSAEFDTMQHGAAHRAVVPVHGEGAIVHVERLDEHLFLLAAEAAAAAPRAGRARSRLLVHPPAMPPGADTAQSEIGSAGPIIAAFDRIVALSRPGPHAMIIAGDTAIDAALAAVLVVDGNLTITGTASFHGLAVVRGFIDIESGAEVIGAVHAADAIHGIDAVEWSPSTVRDAMAAARLDRPQPAGPRAWIPSF